MDLETAAVLDAANANLASWKRLCRQYEEQIRQLKGELMGERADGAGMRAMISALKEQLTVVSPNNKLLQPSGKVYKRGSSAGKAKTNLRLIFEAAHDDNLRKVGIADPARVRESD